MNGWIRLYRKVQDSQMYKSLNSKQRDVLVQCLLMANHSKIEWSWGRDVYECKPGQFITSLDNLKRKCAKDVSIQSVRTSLLILEKWQFLTNKSTKTGRLITICKWEHYQPEKNKINKASNKGLTKTQHLRENNKEKSIYNNFYDSEIERANGDEKYLRFVKFLFCENEENKKLSGILSIRDQLGYKEFCKLKEKASAEKIASCLLKMENDSKYTKGKFSLYRTLNNWVENRFLNNSK